MPLIDKKQMEEEDKAVWEIVKIVAAVAVLGESGSVQCRIAAELLAGVRQVVVSVISDPGMEQLHADYGIGVEYHLE